jgi:hypothetical protein
MRAIALLALALAAGCVGPSELPAPSISSVEPSSGHASEPVPVVIRGEGFFARARQGLEQGQPSLIDATFRVWLDETELGEVRRVDASTLSALVPAGIAVGVHALKLEGPYGTASLPDAYRALGSAASLQAQILAPERASTQQRVEMLIEVTNTGSAEARDVSVALAAPGLSSLTAPVPPTTLAPGASVRFAFAGQAEQPGVCALEATVTGADAEGGEALQATASGSLLIERAARLSGSLSLPAASWPGLTFEARLDVRNEGEALAQAVAPGEPVLAGSATADLVSAPAAADIAGGESHAFVWTYRATGSGTLTFEVGASGKDANSGAQIELSPAQSQPLIVGRPAELAVSIAVGQPVANVGQAVHVTVSVENHGEAAATGVSPSINLSGAGALVATEGPVPTAADLGAGERADFVFDYQASAPGEVGLEPQAAGSDAETAAPLSASGTPASLTIQRRAELQATASAPASANVGQLFELSLRVVNGGDSTARNVTPTLPNLSGPGTAVLLEGPALASAEIAPGAEALFVWRWEAQTAGEIDFDLQAAGTDALDALPAASPTAHAATMVHEPASLSAALSTPSLVGTGSTFRLTLAVTNGGGATALAVTPAVPAISGTTSATILAGPTPASLDLVGGEQGRFTWTLRAGPMGELAASVDASGSDANDGSLLTTGPAETQLAVGEASELFVDPLGDGSSFAFVFGYGGKLFVGPNQSGTGALRSEPDGASPESVSFSFAADVTGGNVSSNSSTAPYPSLGAPGCAPDTASCGPDNENGRGLFASGTLAGTEWLLAAGSRDGGLEYVYATSDHDPVLDFSYIDFNTAGLGGQARTLSAACVLGDRVYLGFPDSGGNRPYLLALLRAPTAPGLDTTPSDVLTLDADKMPGIGRSSPLTLIDAMTVFNDRLYLFNAGGCMRSTTGTPRRYSTFPEDWAACTPSASAWSGKTSVTVTSAAGLTPADRAIPQLAVYQGKLYAARNTTSGPQLWVCRPEGGTDPLQCEADDWSLIAPNGTGDALLSQFDDSGSTRASLLVSTGNRLFVGFDNPGGAVVMASSASDPAARSDFHGYAGCLADAHPATCEGLARNGFGDPASQRIFSAVALESEGSSYLYLVAGDGTGPVRVYRVAE